MPKYKVVFQTSIEVEADNEKGARLSASCQMIDKFSKQGASVGTTPNVWKVGVEELPVEEVVEESKVEEPKEVTPPEEVQARRESMADVATPDPEKMKPQEGGPTDGDQDSPEPEDAG